MLDAAKYALQMLHTQQKSLKMALAVAEAEVQEEEADVLHRWLEAVDYLIGVANQGDRRHGKWEKLKPSDLLYWRCSVCQKVHFTEPPNADYCPGCGARMDEEVYNG